MRTSFVEVDGKWKTVALKICRSPTEKQVKKIKGFQKKAPVHVVPIAQAFGIEVFKDENFPDDLSGLIRKEEDGKYRCYVNATHPTTRRRFTIAHELSHFLLHKKYIGDGITDDYLYRSGLTNEMEREANSLAAEILMPQHLLEDYFDDIEQFSITALADLFWVSPAAMEIRLRNKGKYI